MRTRWVIAVVIVFIMISTLSLGDNQLANAVAAQIDIPTPENTPTLTPTSTCTATPTATATYTAPLPNRVYLPVVLKPPTSPSPPGVYLIGNDTHYVAYGDLHVVGEVFNHTSGIISYVQVYIDVFDSGGRLLDTDWTFTELIDVPPETKACFHLWLDEPLGWSYYDLYGYYHHGGDPLPALTVFNDSAFLELDGDYRVVGMVRNDHGTRVEYVQPVITLYDSGRRVIDCDFTFVNGTHLDPGQTRSFEETFYYRDYSVVTSYQIVVDGNPQ